MAPLLQFFLPRGTKALESSSIPSIGPSFVAGHNRNSIFGLSFSGYVDTRVPYWHLGMHMNMDVTRFLIEGREEQYLRHLFRNFAFNPAALSEVCGAVKAHLSRKSMSAAALGRNRFRSKRDKGRQCR
jgi:hypothetical protein